MKTVILAGGYGSRLSEETHLLPKPMVEIGGRPILWHLMKVYAHFGFNDFVILCGYKGHMIKDYFVNYVAHYSDVTVDLGQNEIAVHRAPEEDWKVTLLDTGLDTMTGGRVLRAKPYLDAGQPFLLTYGDGLANVDILELIRFHNSHGGAITMTSSQPEGRFGALDILDGGRVSKFVEKPRGDGAWINAGYFVCEHRVLDYIESDETSFERDPLERLASDGELHTFQHRGFWRPMDTLRDKQTLDNMWTKGEAGWKMWK